MGSRRGGVQRTHLSPQASIPGKQALLTPGSGGETQNAGGVPFSTLRCCVPEAPGGPGPPGTTGKSPSTPGPTPSGLPGPGPEGAASRASHTTPARLAGARSAIAGTAPPRPPSCADATRPRLLTLSPPPRAGAAATGNAGAGWVDGSPRETKGCGRTAAGAPARAGSLPPPRPAQAGGRSSAHATGRGRTPTVRGQAEAIRKGTNCCWICPKN